MSFTIRYKTVLSQSVCCLRKHPITVAVTLIFFLGATNLSWAQQTCVTNSNGNWTNPGIWTCTPTASLTPIGAYSGLVIIKHAVNINNTTGDITIGGSTTLTIASSGTINFTNNHVLSLTNTSSVLNLVNGSAIIQGNTGGSDIIVGSQTIDINNTDNPLEGPLTINNTGRTTLINPLTVTASTSSTLVCGTLPVTASLSAVSGNANAPYSYSWIAPAGATVSPANASVVSANITTSGAKTFTVIATDNVGFTSVATVSVTSGATSFASLTTSQTGGGYCDAGTVRNVISISATTANATNYTVMGPGSGGAGWTGGTISGTISGNAFSVSRDATTARGGSYTVIIGNAAGCTSTSFVSVTVLASPGLATSPTHSTTTTICSSQQPISLSAIASSGTGPYSYTWEIAPGLTGGAYSSFGSTSVISASILTTFTSGTAAVRYRAQATDAVGCTSPERTLAVLVHQTPALSLTSNGPFTCAQPSILLSASVTGGLSPLNYSFSGPGLTATTPGPAITYLVTSPEAGVYSVTVTGGACSVTATTNVSSATAAPVVTQLGVTTNVSCNGLSNGAIAFTVTGAAPFTITLGGNQTAAIASSGGTASFTGLIANTYTIDVTDANGCSPSPTSSATIAEPATALTISTTAVTNVLCNGGTGSLTVAATGGTGAISYSLNTGATNATGEFTGLAPGSYTVTAGDANGCTAATGTLSVTQPAAALAIANVTSLSANCFGAATGSIAATATGGSLSYTFTLGGSGSGIMPGNTVGFNFIAAGTYSLTLTDGNGCTATQTGIVVTQATAVSLSAPTVTTVSCNGGSNGAINITASGGTASYTYTISSSLVPSTTGSFTGLAAGIYFINATDANSCTTAEVSVTIVEPTALTLSMPSVSSVVCNGGSTGSVSIALTGGAGGYSYTLNTGTTNSIGSFTGLAAGSYTITASDANGCTAATGAIVVNEPTALSLSAPTVTTVACTGGATGAIVLTASGGAGGYSYSLNTGATSSTGSFTGLAAASYTVTVSDANGCTLASGAITVAQAGSLPTVTITPSSTVVCPGTAADLTATGAGGTAGYTFAWSAGTVPATGSAVSATMVIADGGTTKTYSVTITDGNGCTAVSAAPASVSVSPQPTFGTLTPTATTVCSGATVGFSANGLLNGATIIAYSVNGGPASTTTVTVSGGTVSFPAATYPVGSYTITITSLTVNGCSFSPSTGNVTCFTVKALPTVSSLVSTSINCFSNPTGSFTVVAAGTGPFMYSANSTTNATGIFTGLTAGTYPISLTDANGCSPSSVTSVTINQPASAPSISSSIVVSGACTGDLGSLTVVASGGSGTLNYTLTPGGTTNASGVFTGLAAGNYTVTVGDGNGCQVATGMLSVTQATAVVVNQIGSATAVNCFGGATGSVSFQAVGGTNSFTYTITGGASNQTGAFASLTANTYSVTATDGNGCTAVAGPVSVTQPTQLLATASSTSVGCAGGSTGSISVTTTGGIAGYTVSVGGSNSATIASSGGVGSISGLSGGTYSLTVIDANGCTQVSSVTVSQPSTPLAVGVTPSATAVCVGVTVSLTATGSGGTGALTYAWLGGTNPASGSVVSAANTPGVQTYTVTVTDANGCTATQTASVTVNAIPTATLAGNPSTTITCAQPNVTLQAGGGSTYAFAGPGLSQANSAVSTAVVSQSGVFSVTVTTNGCSSTTSIAISQSVVPSSLALGNPAASSVVCVGGSVSVPVGVTNATSLQWYKDGVAVPGQVTATLTLGGIQSSQAGNYRLVATGTCSSLTTIPGFTLTVNSQPTVTLIFSGSATQMGTGIPTITMPTGPGQTVQMLGGVLFEWKQVIDRINGYEIRLADRNTTGIFPINRTGLFTVTITDANGCSRTVQGVIVNP